MLTKAGRLTVILSSGFQGCLHIIPQSSSGILEGYAARIAVYAKKTRRFIEYIKNYIKNTFFISNTGLQSTSPSKIHLPSSLTMPRYCKKRTLPIRIPNAQPIGNNLNILRLSPFAGLSSCWLADIFIIIMYNSVLPSQIRAELE